MLTSAPISTLGIDGSLGEGGGQVLRSSLALSLLTGRPFVITNIRQTRRKPGLRAQHLKAVESAAAIGGALVEGTKIHVPWSPSFHFLDLHWLLFMRRMGFDIQLELSAAGFYPRGGGRVSAEVYPAGDIKPLQLTHCGILKRIRGISAVANLNIGIAERQRTRALELLASTGVNADIELLRLPSTFLLLLAEFEQSQFCSCALGARGKPTERVADEAVTDFLAFLVTHVAVDHYLADQLVLPLALAAGISEVRISQVTQHLTTNAQIVKMLLPVAMEIDGALGNPGTVVIRGCGLGAQH
jgi:RNA 3'-terminal phosphate cyclase